ncbi:MAG: hypothetical protein WHW07_03480 [Bacteroidales bacterium]
MDNEVPKWLKIMQNGSLGEVRTKAFLMDRFWILERSVDIDGADFIIQRRVTHNNLLDRDAPRLGVVQVKFFETESTTHYIPNIYIVDDEGNLRDEFFVMCHAGKEDTPKIFFLTAKMIFDDFSTTTINDVEKFRLPGAVILSTNKYLVTSRKNTLDRIENQLILADFTKNRKFLSWRLPSSSIDASAILPEFKEPIDNWWGEIPKEFKYLKETAQSAMIKVEEIYNLLKEITEEVNPIKAFEYIDDIRYECRDGLGRWSISLPNDLYNEDFELVCRVHLEKVNYLKNEGLLDNYLSIKDNLREKISEFICANLPIDANTVLSITIDFSTKDLTINSINQKLTSADKYWSVPNTFNRFGHLELDTDKYSGIKEIADGKFEYYWLAGRIYMSEDDKNDIPNFYRTSNFKLYYDIMEKIYNDKK